MAHILRKIQGETVREEKQRFKDALSEVVPYMDYFYGRLTARKFPNRELSHIRNVRQRGIIDWDVLEYWFEEFIPQTVEV